MKDNKLIAEFMGANPTKESTNVYAYDMYGIIDTIEDGVNEQHFFLSSEMKFHSSWDWLMPVVSKIGNIKNYGINGTLDWLSESEFNIEQERDGLYTIEDVFLSVVEFIKRTKKST